MNSVTRGSSVTADHYNGLDPRVRRTGAAGTLGFIHAPSGELLATTMQNGDADMGSRFIDVDGEVVGLIRSGKAYAVHNNPLGRAQSITDPAKTVVWRATLYSHQRKVSLDDIGGYALDFPGQYVDGESGLNYNWHRFYDPTTAITVTPYQSH